MGDREASLRRNLSMVAQELWATKKQLYEALRVIEEITVTAEECQVCESWRLQNFNQRCLMHSGAREAELRRLRKHYSTVLPWLKKRKWNKRYNAEYRRCVEESRQGQLNAKERKIEMAKRKEQEKREAEDRQLRERESHIRLMKVHKEHLEAQLRSVNQQIGEE